MRAVAGRLGQLRGQAEWATVAPHLYACLALSCGLGCGTETHTVGQLEATPQVVRASAGRGAPNSGAAGSSTSPGNAGGGIDTGAPSNVGSNGAAASPSAFPEPPDAAVLIGDPAVSCMGSTELAARRRLDLYLMVDRNITLSVPWVQIVDGIATYVDEPEASGTGVGIGYFPIDQGSPQQTCDADEYAMPDTPVGLLPGNASLIQASFPAPAASSLGGSPTKAALEGAIEYARSRWFSFGFTQAVVIITDAAQDFACFLEPRELQDVAALGYTGSPSIPTYVVELTVPELDALLNVIGLLRLNLNEVALRGGTVRAREVSLNLVSEIARSFSDLMLQIQHDAEPCSYEVNQAVRDDIDGTVLGTGETSGSPAPDALVRLESEDDCGLGYYLDDADNPEWATLCPATCAAVKGSRRSVWWLTDCTR